MLMVYRARCIYSALSSILHILNYTHASGWRVQSLCFCSPLMRASVKRVSSQKHNFSQCVLDHPCVISHSVALLGLSQERFLRDAPLLFALGRNQQPRTFEWRDKVVVSARLGVYCPAAQFSSSLRLMGFKQRIPLKKSTWASSYVGSEV